MNLHSKESESEMEIERDSESEKDVEREREKKSESESARGEEVFVTGVRSGVRDDLRRLCVDGVIFGVCFDSVGSVLRGVALR